MTIGVERSRWAICGDGSSTETRIGRNVERVGLPLETEKAGTKSCVKSCVTKSPNRSKLHNLTETQETLSTLTAPLQTKAQMRFRGFHRVERVTGIEPV